MCEANKGEKKKLNLDFSRVVPVTFFCFKVVSMSQSKVVVRLG